MQIATSGASRGARCSSSAASTRPMIGGARALAHRRSWHGLWAESARRASDTTTTNRARIAGGEGRRGAEEAETCARGAIMLLESQHDRVVAAHPSRAKVRPEQGEHSTIVDEITADVVRISALW